MKAWIYVCPAAGAAAGSSPSSSAPHRICWYVGTSDAMVERALRSQLRLPARARLLLRDADGDLVPVSASLPHEQHFALVVVPPHPDDGREWRCAACRSVVSGDGGEAAPVVNGDAGSNGDSEQIEHRRGRKRPHSAQGAVTSGFDSLMDPPGLSPASAMRGNGALLPAVAPRVRSVAQVVTQFLDVFTRPIADDDNVSFIPSTGRFALYALFCALVTDRSLHPKSQDAFYKMTSMQGKVDRQRAIRYYRAPASSANRPAEYVRYKPQGKGPLLRQYLVVDSASVLAEAAKSAEPLAAVLDRDADETVARYMDFVRGFVPVSKAEYQAHRDRHDAMASEEGDGDSSSGLHDR